MTEAELAERLRAADAEAAFEKIGIGLTFVVKNVLAQAGTLTVAQVAMLWMGMPNKHDRKRTRTMFELLEQAGLARPLDDEKESWAIDPTASPGSPP
jgi:hypothetical protein